MNKVIVSVLLFVMTALGAFSQEQEPQQNSQSSQTAGMGSALSSLTAVSEGFVYDESKMVAIPNTNIRIQPPEYFKYSDSVPGFLHVGTMSSIQVEEVVGTSYLLISRAMDSAYFASQGMRLISVEPVVMHDGSDGLLFTAEMKLKGFVFERLILMSGDYHFTMWINAGYIKLMSNKLKPIILQSMLTSKIYD
ncbi:MAG: hypothetical protein II575_10145 [Bacteroidales bacterium]|nr:hypothetical protein [Bacteroidales bacterium]MBQ1720144.1 hypothetical protein [Bacteroidales bacterium]MBQ1732518.1 hypothetical protein [Bacteroidales bacterium]MBQ2574571.1 hypothetical protein [Bacteroidales bacterium]MBQ5424549.1 hypothetical protein [Bacteroidales bacterium]